MPELPPASPELPVIADKFQLPAPVPVISLKSALVIVTVPALIVAGELNEIAPLLIPEAISKRLVTELPLAVKVPVTVVVAFGSNNLSVVAAVPVLVRALKVLVPAMVFVPLPVRLTVA